MTLAITGLYAAMLAIVFTVLAAMVIARRGKTHISIMHGDDTLLAEAIRRHGNFIEFVPLALILMAIAETQGAAPGWLHASGALLVLSRLAHPFGIRHDNPVSVARIAGTTGTLIAMAVPLVIILSGSIAGFGK